MSLRVRMGLASGVAVALAVIAVAVSAYAGTSSELKGQLDQSLQSLTGQVLDGSGASPNNGAGRGDGQPPSGVSSVPGQGMGFGLGPALGRGLGSRVPLGQGGSLGRGQGGAGTNLSVDPDEGLALDTGGGPAFGGAAGTLTLVRRNGSVYVPHGQKYKIPVNARAKAIADRGTGHYYTDMTVKGTQIRVLATGIGGRGALLAALPLAGVNRALSDQLLLLVLIAAGGILLAGVLGLLVARTALAPIGRFTRQTEAIAANPDRLDQERVEVSGGDELARLAQTFNRTLDALDSSVQAQRSLVADASHELRTPIATIRANLQLMRDERLLTPEDREALRADVIEELDELTALVSDVVELARGAKRSGETGDVRVDAIVSAAVERARRRAPQLTVHATIEPTLVHGEGDRIARAIANLLDNAAKWSPSGATIEVVLHAGELTVRDHGPGFHEGDLPFVFDRFHRARDARSKPGSGLGLAIVRQAAEAHAGFVTAANADGGGALMRVGFGPALELAEPELEDAVGSP
jgi:two-component system sensor histidine kinase MprB